MKNANMSLLSSRALLLTATAATLALSSTLISKPAFAGTATSNLDVSANVNATCSITTNPVAFGDYNPSNPSDANASGTVTTTCTVGSPATITLGEGQNANSGSTAANPARRLSVDGTNFLEYFLYQDSNRTTVWGNAGGTGVDTTGTGTPQALIVYGTITAAQSVPPGAYTDTVVATVTF